jgi:hypothetical protein
MRVVRPRTLAVAALAGFCTVTAGASAATPIAGLGWRILPATTLRAHLTQDCFIDVGRG